MIRFFPMIVLALAACNNDKDGTETGDPDDTGVVVDDSGGGGDDTDSLPPPCEIVPLEITPEDGQTGWYFRDPMAITFSDAVTDATIQVLDPAGAEVATTIEWADGNFQATVTPVDGLAGSTTYSLHIEVCQYTGSVSFTTDVYGDPMSVEASTLIGGTYLFDLGEAEVTEPEDLGYLLALYLTQPLLIGVKDANDSELTLIGAQGYLKSDGTYRQEGDDVWSFPAADFTTAPFFSAYTESITIDYAGTAIPLGDFHLEGTFAPDGTSIGGAAASGLGDTRNMGPLLGLDEDPNAVCGLIADLALGVTCEACFSDGEPYCLYLEVEFANAELLPDFTLEEPAE